MNALEIKGLNKSFQSNFLIKQFHILKGIDITVRQGEIYGFLGPNGAGKTTTMKCILGIIFPDSGEISIFGQSAKKAESRRRVGFLPEHPYFYDYLTPIELLKFTGGIFSMAKEKIQQRSNELIDLVGLSHRKDMKLRKFSKGMIQRIGLAQALIHDPDFVILDEPFSGLDPIGRKELRDIVFSLKASGKTIFFSSHILQDMEMMVDRVGIILDGEISKEGKLSDLISNSDRFFEIIFSGIPESVLAASQWQHTFRDTDCIMRLATGEEMNDAIRWIIAQNGDIVSVIPVKRTLEDIFLAEIGDKK
jgi:ABC-2 type transport system ATP-binding protein